MSGLSPDRYVLPDIALRFLPIGPVTPPFDNRFLTPGKAGRYGFQIGKNRNASPLQVRDLQGFFG